MKGSSANATVAPVWCAVANVVRERPFGPGGLELRRGTAHFSPGAKVYIRSVYWGMGGEQVEVVGRHRGSLRLVSMVIRTAWLEAPRVKLAYQPSVVARLQAPPSTLGVSAHGDGFVPWDGSPEARARAERVVRAIQADVESAGRG